MPNGDVISVVLPFGDVLLNLVVERELGVGLGFAIQAARKIIQAKAGYREFAKSGKGGFATDFVIDAMGKTVSAVTGMPHSRFAIP